MTSYKLRDRSGAVCAVLEIDKLPNGLFNISTREEGDIYVSSVAVCNNIRSALAIKREQQAFYAMCEAV